MKGCGREARVQNDSLHTLRHVIEPKLFFFSYESNRVARRMSKMHRPFPPPFFSLFEISSGGALLLPCADQHYQSSKAAKQHRPAAAQYDQIKRACALAVAA